MGQPTKAATREEIPPLTVLEPKILEIDVSVERDSP
jgi:hypothetical protein